jgi:hypothetical protein
MFNPARGMFYRKFLDTLHQRVLFDWYLEVGCRTGASFAPVRSKTIAVDPYFRVDINVIGTKPALHVFQQTSDAFFASGFLQRNGIRLGLSFLDGMHLYEFLLRDFINAEAASDPNGVIILHDCVPFGLGMTTRDLDNLPKGAWTGDVWKLLPILQRWRPDLTLTVLACAPTGLVCVSGLDPANRVLADTYADITAEFDPVDLQTYGVERFAGSYAFTRAKDIVESDFALFRPASIDPALALDPRRHST